MAVMEVEAVGQSAGGLVTAPVAGQRSPLGSLSPSRASDFMSCPLKYRFRVVDRLPEPPSEAATRGTLVHAVLERLFELPAGERTLAAAHGMVGAQWELLCEQDDSLAEALFPERAGLQTWLDSAAPLLEAYFSLEDPSRLAPVARELLVSHTTDDGLTLRGIVDRLDEAGPHSPMAGALRVVDYKTGRAPGPAFEARVMFQLKFYALVLWRTRGVVPAMLELLYLGGTPERLRYTPDEAELNGFERTLRALGDAIARAHATGDWRPRASRLCDWCSHQSLCPAFGGTPPPLPGRGDGSSTGVQGPGAPGSASGAGAAWDEGLPELVDVTG